MSGTSTPTKRVAGKLETFPLVSAAVAIIVLVVVVPPTATMVLALTEPVDMPADATIRAEYLVAELSEYNIGVHVSHEFHAEDDTWVAEYEIRLDGDRDDITDAVRVIPDADVVHFGSPMFMFAVFAIWGSVSAAVLIWRIWLDVANFPLGCLCSLGGITAIIASMSLLGGLFPIG